MYIVYNQMQCLINIVYWTASIIVLSDSLSIEETIYSLNWQPNNIDFWTCLE